VAHSDNGPVSSLTSGWSVTLFLNLILTDDEKFSFKERILADKRPEPVLKLLQK
jgi:hypothetical protein